MDELDINCLSLEFVVFGGMELSGKEIDAVDLLEMLGELLLDLLLFKSSHEEKVKDLVALLLVQNQGVLFGPQQNEDEIQEYFVQLVALGPPLVLGLEHEVFEVLNELGKQEILIVVRGIFDEVIVGVLQSVHQVFALVMVAVARYVLRLYFEFFNNLLIKLLHVLYLIFSTN